MRPNNLDNVLGQVVKSGGERYEVTNKGSDEVKTGYPVKLKAGAGKSIHVEKLSSTGDKAYGFVVHEPIVSVYKKGSTFTVARKGSHIALTATEAITRGAELELANLVGGVAIKSGGDLVAIAVSDASKDELVIVELV